MFLSQFFQAVLITDYSQRKEFALICKQILPVRARGIGCGEGDGVELGGGRVILSYQNDRL